MLISNKDEDDFSYTMFSLSGFTVWQKLEEENREFFNAYYLRLMVKHQIMEFNKLLEQQVRHMQQMHPSGLTSVQNTNGSHIQSSKFLDIHSCVFFFR